MKDLTWDESLSIDVDEIDDDHRRLVSLFNILNHAMSEGDSPEYIDAVLEELISCTAWHFRHEERLMLKYRYEDAAAHKSEHQDLIESVGKLQEKFRQEGNQLSDEDVEFLEHWLTEHILVADMKMGSYLAQTM